MGRKIIVALMTIIALSACSERGLFDRSPVQVTPMTVPEITRENSFSQPRTGTSMSLAPTFTPVPTVTRPPTPAATKSNSVNLTTSADFGSDRNPLTGMEMKDPSLLERRPIAVKISNSPAQFVRPQSGLSQADIVFEHVTEGPITRFTAIIYGQTPPDMGPIRSARLIDLEIPVMYDAALAFSGSSIGVSRKLFSSEFSHRILRTYVPGYYRTGADKPYEHTLYGEPSLFWQELNDRGENSKPLLAPNMVFASVPPAGGIPSESFVIRYRDWSYIDWEYDAATGRYLRWADGEPHVDANSGEQISAANVLVLFAEHQLDTTICEYQTGNECRAHSMEIHIWGQGQVVLFRDGLQYDGFWTRVDSGDMLTFIDNDGQPLPLQLGNTWFQVMPLNYPSPYEITSQTPSSSR
jgi:hypothetical protein